MGNLAVTDEQIDIALKDAHAYNFVQMLPQKLNT